MTSPQSYEVIVSGGGKGGKTLATELGNKSVKMALIERSAEPGVQLLDMPDFPEAYKPEALGGREFLDLLRAEKILEWSFFCPSAEFAPGQRTGKFRLGKDRLLNLPNGESKISMEDFAIAMIDELESPRHVREGFTVGY